MNDNDDQDDKSPSPRLQRRAAKRIAQQQAYLESVGADDESLKAEPSPKKRGNTSITARVSDAEMEDRRAAVMKLRLRGHSFEEISKRLGVSYHVVRRDWEAVRLKEGEEVKDFDKNNFVKQTLMTYDDIAQAAWHEFEQANSGTKMKLDALREARAALGDKIKAMKELNVVVDAPQTVNHNISVDIVNTWTPEFQKKVAQSMLQASLTPQLSEPVPDDFESEIIDVEVVETKED